MLQFLEGTNTTLQDHLMIDNLCPSQVTQISIAAPSFQVQSMREIHYHQIFNNALINWF